MRFVDVVPRPAWDAEPYVGDPVRVTHPGEFVVAHHTDGREPDGPEGPRRIQRFHQDTRGWRDIAYHYVIDREGAVFEGRMLGWQGAHARGANDTIGVALIGQFSIEEPTDAQLEAFARLVASLRAEGALSTVRILGHGEVAASNCPERLDERFDWIEERALDLLEHGDDGGEGDALDGILLFVDGRAGTPDALAALWHAIGSRDAVAVTASRELAESALERGSRVVAVGGPAAEAFPDAEPIVGGDWVETEAELGVLLEEA